MYSRALSLRNLVSGYECGRVFPAGVGPGSPSRDAANCLPSRFILSIETRRRHGLLRMVFPGAALFGRCGGTREVESSVAENLVAFYRVSTHQRFGKGGRQLDRRRARGVLNPCARESKARTGRFLREKLMSDHGLFSSYEGQQGAANGQNP